MITLLLLGFVLSLDSFRVSLGLGATRLRPARRAQVVIAFGLCDALAPLAGELIGQSIMAGGAEWLEYLGPLMLCGYGAYVICVSRRRDGGAEPEESRWVVLGLPLALSLDNLIAGTSLGMLGFPPLLSAAVIGGISALMSLAGFLLGKTAIGLLKLESEMIGGVALVVIGLTLALGNLSGFVH
jgi:putative Mn2+ efflux pump MntP